MHRFKRNQINDALETILATDDGEESGPIISIRVKRLLNADRMLALGRERFAFHSKAAPGSGSEVGYSGYEAFALLAGLCFLGLGWPQQTVVRIMRLIRSKLEPEYTRIRQLGPDELVTGPEVAAMPRPPGSPVLTSDNPVFLAIFASGRASVDRSDLASDAIAICRGEFDLMTLWKTRATVGLTSMTNIEITHLVVALEAKLARSKPRARGRRAR